MFVAIYHMREKRFLTVFVGPSGKWSSPGTGEECRSDLSTGRGATSVVKFQRHTRHFLRVRHRDVDWRWVGMGRRPWKGNKPKPQAHSLRVSLLSIHTQLMILVGRTHQISVMCTLVFESRECMSASFCFHRRGFSAGTSFYMLLLKPRAAFHGAALEENQHLASPGWLSGIAP